jgi:Ras-related protein Rab-11A
LLSQFIRTSFNSDFKSTIGVEFATTNIEINKKMIKLQIWDTAGQERYQAVTTAYYRGADAALLLYDITNQNSFNSISRWLEGLRSVNQDVVVILIGNKIDLVDVRQVSEIDGKSFAEKESILFLETSAKDNLNVKQSFLMVTQTVMENKEKSLDYNESENQLSLVKGLEIQDIVENDQQNAKKGCC